MHSKKYKREWKAICPRYDKQLTYADFVTPNCGKGKIKANVIAESIFLGCEHCDHIFPRLKCSCGTSIQNSQLHVKGGIKKWGCGKLFHYTFVILVSLPIILLIIGKLLGYR